MKVRGAHPYFRDSRKRHGRVTYEVAKRVAEHRRSWPRLQDDGRVRVYGYSPGLHEWVRVIVTEYGFLLNGFVDPDAREIVRRMAREGR